MGHAGCLRHKAPPGTALSGREPRDGQRRARLGAEHRPLRWFLWSFCVCYRCFCLLSLFLFAPGVICVRKATASQHLGARTVPGLGARLRAQRQRRRNARGIRANAKRETEEPRCPSGAEGGEAAGLPGRCFDDGCELAGQGAGLTLESTWIAPALGDTAVHLEEVNGG